MSEPTTKVRLTISLLETYTISLTNATIETCTAKSEIIPHIHGCKQGATSIEEIDTSMLGQRSPSTISNVMITMNK